MARKDGKQEPCRICHNFCKGGKPDDCRMHVWDDFLSVAIFPCNAREYVNKNTREYVRFEANGQKYSADISKWANKKMISGDGWQKFTSDFNLGKGTLVFFDMSKRPRTATIHQFQANPASAADNMVVDGDETDFYADEGELMTEHSKGVQLARAEQDMLNAFVLGYNMEYGGTPFVHRFTKTNIETGNMKLPCRVMKKLAIPKQGMIGVSSGSGGSESAISYTTSSDGRIILSKTDWMNFVLEHNLEANKHAMLYFKTTTDPQLKLAMIVRKL